MKLIVGLGNPGSKYERTRHNIGFRVLDFLADSWGGSFSQKKFKGEFATVSNRDHDKVFLLKPQTFMNLSGESAGPMAGFYKITRDDVLVVYDDVDLPFGKLRFAAKGGAGGHNGIKSLIQHLGGQDFHRLKVGVGRPQHRGQDTADHVLQKFSAAEEQVIEKSSEILVSALDLYLRDGIVSAMNEFNGVALN